MGVLKSKGRGDEICGVGGWEGVGSKVGLINSRRIIL